ncbi:GNAT family N-acetyltransferase [Actinoplanes sp. HUAS TT8]|uniref:GNAT family N-acetyltransferase n=1 Tax=Actinoplanes sp. HUAS TT8 TaxID=3447453 RepID=UPI003F51D494
MIRTFDWDDYDSVAAVWAATGADVLSRAELETKLTRDPELFLVAVADDPAPSPSPGSSPTSSPGTPAGLGLDTAVGAGPDTAASAGHDTPTGTAPNIAASTGHDTTTGTAPNTAASTGHDTPTTAASAGHGIAGGAGLDAVAGAILGTWDGRRGWIFRLAVDPARRREGIATRLVHELEARFEALGCPRINLLVMPNNEAGLRFWQRHGYLPVPDVLCTKPLQPQSPEE